MHGLILDATHGQLLDSDYADYVGALLLTDDFENVVEIRIWSRLGMWVHVVDQVTPRAGTRLEVTPAQLAAIDVLQEPERSNLWEKLAARYVDP